MGHQKPRHALPEPASGSTGKAKGPVRRRVISVVIVLVGIAILLDPVVSTAFNIWMEQRAAGEYSRLVDKGDMSAMHAQLKRADEYNRHRAGVPILDPWSHDDTAANTAYRDYLSQLNLFDVMARLRIPSIDVDLPVYHGTSDDVLAKGIGHLYGSDLPVGGKGTHAVLTGHTGLKSATLFDNLKDVKVGDSIYIDVYDRKLRYKVYNIEVVLPDKIDSLRAQPGQDTVTLITCTPYGVNSHRLLVHAKRVPYDAPEKASGGRGLPGQLWMWLFGLGAMVALLLLVLAMRASRKRSAKSLN